MSSIVGINSAVPRGHNYHSGGAKHSALNGTVTLKTISAGRVPAWICVWVCTCACVCVRWCLLHLQSPTLPPLLLKTMLRARFIPFYRRKGCTARQWWQPRQKSGSIPVPTMWEAGPSNERIRTRFSWFPRQWGILVSPLLDLHWWVCSEWRPATC